MLRPLMAARTRLTWSFAITLGMAGLTTLGSLGAHAAEPEPSPDVKPEAPADPVFVDDLDRARTLIPPPGGLSGVIEKQADPDVPHVAREVEMIVVHGRWVTVPGAIFESFFSDYQSLSNPSFGAAYEWGDLDGAMWAIELDWSSLVIGAGNWLENNTPPFGASYAEPGLSLLSVDAMYRRQFRFTESFRGMLGAGLGLGVLLGNIKTAEVLPTCVEPVSECAHWPGATNENADLPTRIVPILHITAGLEVDLGEGFAVRLQGGFRDMFYLGLSVGKTL